MQTISDILAAWPSDAELGRDLDVPYPTILAWKQRGSIPAAYWCDIVRVARQRGHGEITADLLARLHARGPRVLPAPGFAEEQAPAVTGAQDIAATDIGESSDFAAGHFSRWQHLRRSHFASRREIAAHIEALRDEWKRR
jgi:hypothetical protein